MYTLELGTNDENIVKQAMRSGQAIPDRILNAPTLRLGLQFYLHAFFDLDADRALGMGQGRIPWTAIQEYAAYYQLDNEQSDLLHLYIRAMDTAHLKRINEKA